MIDRAPFIKIPVHGRGGIIAHAKVDPCDHKELSRHRWHLDRDGAVWCHDRRNRTTIKMHRMVTKAPRGMDVDHINHDRLDNRRANLRVCTHAQNMLNHLGGGGDAGYRGVRRAKNRWQARIAVCGREVHLGSFRTKEEAWSARRDAELIFRGEFAAPVVA